MKPTFPGNVSFSALNLYKSCQRNFFYSKIAKLKPDCDIETKYGRFGNCVHEVLEEVTNEYYPELLTSKWDKYKLYDTDCSINKAKGMIFRGWNKLQNSNVLSREQKLNFEYKGIKFKAIIDVFEDEYCPIDWKTSSYNAKKAEDYKLQLLFYCWCVYITKGIIPKKATLIFLEPYIEFQWSFTKEEILEMQKNIDETIVDISNKKEFEDYIPNFKSCFFCEHKNTCNKDELLKTKYLKIDVTIRQNDLVIEKNFRDMAYDRVIDEMFSYELDNSYHIRAALKKKGIEYDCMVKMWKIDSKTKKEILPIGFLKKYKELVKLYEEFSNKKIILTIFDERQIVEKPIEISCNLDLRDYQKEAIEHIIKDKVSITEICTGAGKTYIAAEIINRIKQKTLFVVDRGVLLQQTKKEFDKIFKINCGTITHGEIIEGDDLIYIATIQTLVKYIEDGKKYKEQFGNILEDFNCVIIDEAHGAKSKSYKMLLENMNSEYKIALTGTAYSDGNNSLELYRSFGFPDYKIKAIDLIKLGYLTNPEIIFLDYDPGFILNGNYNELYEQILKSESRLNLVKQIVDKHINNNILIMADRIEHITILKEKLRNSYIITGSTKDSQRNKIIEEIKTSKGNILIATSSIIQKGVDIPSLDVIVNYSANEGSIKTIQSLGRILRRSQGKEKAYYYDFKDKTGALRKHTKARLEVLRKQGYEI